jgi:hypothetical protein
VNFRSVSQINALAVVAEHGIIEDGKAIWDAVTQPPPDSAAIAGLVPRSIPRVVVVPPPTWVKATRSLLSIESRRGGQRDRGWQDMLIQQQYCENRAAPSVPGVEHLPADPNSTGPRTPSSTSPPQLVV